jgi:hypothetical protein
LSLPCRRDIEGKQAATSPARGACLRHLAMNETTTATDYRCPKHPDERLKKVLRGGAGFCVKCRTYTQAAGVEMPQLDAAIARKRELAAKQAKTKKQMAR